MLNFEFHNPVRIAFGRGTIAELKNLLPEDARIMIIYGGGSIKRNGVYDQVMEAIAGRDVCEFGGIEPNPLHETCMKAVEQAKSANANFLLSVGGGSALDATKYIAAAMLYEGEDPYDMCLKKTQCQAAIKLGCVLTLPATGSEMNINAVISRASTQEKHAFFSEHVYPQFAILDPETTFTLPERQTANGIVDAFIHVIEQYVTYDVNSPLVDRQAEAILLTLIEEGPKVMANPTDYDARANIMWCATHALNGILKCGAVGDWATHLIGHELTALYDLDHARALAVVLPGLWQHERERKKGKLLKYAERIWQITDGSEDERIDAAIARTETFFRSLGLGTTFAECDIPADTPQKVFERFTARGGVQLGEHQDIGAQEAKDILALRA